jgi:hypothetical protein
MRGRDSRERICVRRRSLKRKLLILREGDFLELKVRSHLRDLNIRRNIWANLMKTIKIMKRDSISVVLIKMITMELKLITLCLETDLKF